jgi:hypothetical protein
MRPRLHHVQQIEHLQGNSDISHNSLPSSLASRHPDVPISLVGTQDTHTQLVPFASTSPPVYNTIKYNSMLSLDHLRRHVQTHKPGLFAHVHPQSLNH